MITGTEQLYGNPGHKITFGLLVRLDPERGIYGLQEGRKTVQLNLKHFVSSRELVIQGSYYVVEGIIVDLVFASLTVL